MGLHGQEVSKGKRKPRIVYLSDAALEVTARLAKAYPTGKLFRNRDGQPWDKDTVSRRFARKKKKLWPAPHFLVQG